MDDDGRHEQRECALLDGGGLVVNPLLAEAIGLNAAIALRQLHYWLQKQEQRGDQKFYKDNRWWVYNSYPEWKRDNFPFWSVDTVRRAFKKLEKLGYIVVVKHAKGKFDQRYWYTIEYEALDELARVLDVPADDGTSDYTNVGECDGGRLQNAIIDEGKSVISSNAHSAHRSTQNPALSYTETTTENSTETTTENFAGAAAPARASPSTSNGRHATAPEPKTKPPKARARSPAQQAQAAMCAAIADVCFCVPDSDGFDLLPEQDKRNIRKAAKHFRDRDYGPDDVREFGAWWRRNDWRGRQKQQPTVRQLKSEWYKFINSGHSNSDQARRRYISGEFADYIEH